METLDEFYRLKIYLSRSFACNMSKYMKLRNELIKYFDIIEYDDKKIYNSNIIYEVDIIIFVPPEQKTYESNLVIIGKGQFTEYTRFKNEMYIFIDNQIKSIESIMPMIYTSSWKYYATLKVIGNNSVRAFINNQQLKIKYKNESIRLIKK